MPATSLTRIVICLLVAGPFAGGLRAAGEHPRVLLSDRDLPRIRHACGLRQSADDAADLGRFGRHSDHYSALRTHFARRVVTRPMPGELIAAAFLHLVDPDGAGAAARLEMINAALRRETLPTGDALESLIALDWCWDAVDTQARRDFLLALRRRVERFERHDTPVDQRTFGRKLTGLLLAVVVDERDDPSASWRERRSELREAAAEYFGSTFAAYVQWRGLAPTSPAAGPREERDAALLIELVGNLRGEDQWSRHRTDVGRWLEHHVLSSVSHPSLQFGFVRDFGSDAPRIPLLRWDGMQPLTAHLIAARTRDAAAAAVADRVEEAMDREGPFVAVWRWVPIVFDTTDIERCDTTRLPTARNLGGAVVFRGQLPLLETAIWIEAGQPFLHRRQHFDAGHFLIRAGGQLAVAGGDNVALEAVASKGGTQRLGDERDEFDFAQYGASTIAHNCLVVWDAGSVPRWYGQRYAPVGGQRLIEGHCDDFAVELADSPRQVARQLAYGQDGDRAYLCLDLTPAYERKAVHAYTREFIFLQGVALIIVDRLQVDRRRAMPTWVLNLPARPTIDGADLPADARIAGDGNDAGVWSCADASSLRWQDLDGRLRLVPLLPAGRRVLVVGGPAARLTVPDGSCAGRSYMGGAADSFERLVIPSRRRLPRNAWYRLGTPTVLGDAFGRVPHWGRVEIEPVARSNRHTFVTALLIDRRGAVAPPRATLTMTDDGMRVAIETESGTSGVTLFADRPGGSVQTDGGGQWKLPAEVCEDGALPSRPGG